MWETDGEPYQYRIATRYEIPCRVSGTVVVDGERHEVHGTGQRDHSWGVRDWWAMNWCWMAGRLDDGSRVHAVHMRLPGMAPFGIGYVQGAGRELVELTQEGVDVTEELGPDGLPTSARLRLDPPGLDLEVQPIAHGPLRLVSDDGRLSRFPRVLCGLRTGDGRTGHGWIEWNLNEAPARAAACAGAHPLMASDTPVLWQLRFSHYNEKARWALDYKGIPTSGARCCRGPHLLRAKRLYGGETLPVLILEAGRFPTRRRSSPRSRSARPTRRCTRRRRMIAAAPRARGALRRAAGATHPASVLLRPAAGCRASARGHFRPASAVARGCSIGRCCP